MIRYKIQGEPLWQAIIHAGMMASLDPDRSYVIVCGKCDRPIDDHKHFGDCEMFQRELK